MYIFINHILAYNSWIWETVCIAVQLWVTYTPLDKVGKHIVPFKCACIRRSCSCYFAVDKQTWACLVCQSTYPLKGLWERMYAPGEGQAGQACGVFPRSVSAALWCCLDQVPTTWVQVQVSTSVHLKNTCSIQTKLLVIPTQVLFILVSKTWLFSFIWLDLFHNFKNDFPIHAYSPPQWVLFKICLVNITCPRVSSALVCSFLLDLFLFITAPGRVTVSSTRLLWVHQR